MSDRKPGSPTGHEAEQRAFDLLGSLFPSFRSEVRTGSVRDRYVLDGLFRGRFRGQQGRWVVEVTSTRSISGAKKLESLVRSLKEFGDTEYDGLLVVLVDGPSDHTRVNARLRDRFPHKFVQTATVEELELTTGFDDYYHEYPGPIAALGHNSDLYKDTIEAIDAVATRLASSNTTGLKADVRDRLLVEVQSGRSLLKTATVRVVALSHTLVPALKFIAENCAKVVVGELAKEALKALAKLIFS